MPIYSLNFIEEGRAQLFASISSLLRTEEKEMTYEIAPCQRMSEKDVGDCGVLAIAFATAIANGIDPINCFFESRAIRKHLFDCFVAKEITLFPSSSRRCTTRPGLKKSFPVCCYCRRTEYKATMEWDVIECENCKDWFLRRRCTDYPSNPEKVTWFCDNCKWLSLWLLFLFSVVFFT